MYYLIGVDESEMRNLAIFLSKMGYLVCCHEGESSEIIEHIFPAESCSETTVAVKGEKVAEDDFKLVDMLNIETVTGYSLDLIGKIIKLDRRPVLLSWTGMTWGIDNWGEANWGDSSLASEVYIPMSDETFRKLLNMRILQLLLPRTLDNLLMSIKLILPDMVFTYTEAVNLITINYELSSVNLEEKQLIVGGYLLMPQGCKLVINEVS